MYTNPRKGVPNFRDSVDDAFDFAATAVKLYQGGNVNALRASNFLFTEATAGLAIRNLAGVAAMSAYQGIVTNMKEQVQGGEVMFSCGFSMMKSEPMTYPNGQVFFWEKNSQYQEQADDAYFSCRDGTIDEDGLSIDAYTLDWPDPTKPQIIRFCPVFLSQIAKQRWSSSQQIHAAWLVDIPPEVAIILAKQAATPIDLYGLLELAILHELTHTRQGGNTEDYGSPNVKQVGGSGWLYATSVGLNRGYNNAESVAFQGLLSKLIQLGFGVDQNGYLFQLEAPI